MGRRNTLGSAGCLRRPNPQAKGGGLETRTRISRAGEHPTCPNPIISRLKKCHRISLPMKARKGPGIWKLKSYAPLLLATVPGFA